MNGLQLLAPATRYASLVRAALHSVIAFGLSFGIALGAYVLMHGTPIMNPTFLATTLLALACLWGSWLGSTWMRTRSSIGWLFIQTFLAAFAVCGSAAALTWFAVSAEPLEVAATNVSSDDRRRLVKLFQEHDPRDLRPDETTTLTITEPDLNGLVSWGLSLLPGDQHAQLQLGDGEVSANVTFELPPISVVHG